MGKERWRQHQETVSRFWDRVSAYLGSLDVPLLKVYQDGLPADGDAGRRIVVEAAQRGSRNYQLILALLTRGAKLCRTEDPVLLRQEQQNLLSLLRADPVDAGEIAAYRAQRERLAEERDQHIAGTISTTLQEGETGVLFVGAYHQIVPRLDKDIGVETVLAPERAQTYFQELLEGQDDARLQELAAGLLESLPQIS